MLFISTTKFSLTESSGSVLQEQMGKFNLTVMGFINEEEVVLTILSGTFSFGSSNLLESEI